MHSCSIASTTSSWLPLLNSVSLSFPNSSLQAILCSGIWSKFGGKLSLLNVANCTLSWFLGLSSSKFVLFWFSFCYQLAIRSWPTLSSPSALDCAWNGPCRFSFAMSFLFLDFLYIATVCCWSLSSPYSLENRCSGIFAIMILSHKLRICSPSNCLSLVDALFRYSLHLSLLLIHFCPVLNPRASYHGRCSTRNYYIFYTLYYLIFLLNKLLNQNFSIFLFIL